MRPLRRVGDLLLWVTAAFGVVAVALSAAMWLTGGRVVVVQSGSMEPTYPTGSVALVRRVDPTKVQKGDVVALSLPGGQRVMHRVVGIRDTDAGVEVQTKGDANATVDGEPVVLQSNKTVWRAGAVIPGLGLLASGLRAPFAGFALAAALLGPMALARRDRSALPVEAAAA